MIKAARLFFLHPLILQITRFGIIGGSATITHFSTVIILVHFLNMHPLSANVFGYAFGFIVSYIGHQHWTFAETAEHIKQTLPRYFLIVFLCFFANEGMYFILLHAFHIVYWLALIIVLGSVALITFLINKLWVFKA